MVKHTISSQNISSYELIVLLLTCLIPFLVPFSLSKNIDLQALILVITGEAALFGLLLKRRSLSFLPHSVLVLVGIYISFCMISLIAHPTLDNLVGSRLIRLGSLELVACVTSALLIRKIDSKQLARWLYVTCIVLAVVTIPFQLWTSHIFARFGGVFHQPDHLAVWMAVGFLLGVGLWREYPKQRLWLGIGQASLTVILLFTQTRVIIALLALILIIMAIRARTNLGWHIILGGTIIACLLVGVGVSKTILPGVLTNPSYAQESIVYRVHLQKFAVKSLPEHPLWGYGAGGLPAAMPCPSLHDKALQATCHSGHYFDSSHNIFLDRFLSLGWIGGLAFAAIVVLALFKGLQSTKGMNHIFAYCVLLLSLYYFTNVTSVTIELLLWIFLFHAFPARTNRI